MTTRELDVILTKRPKLNDLEIGDMLHIDTEKGNDVFMVLKVETDVFLMQSGGNDDVVEYSKSMIEKMLRSFGELHKPNYRITILDMEEE
ncbi:MAG: hypothetical protein K0A90_06025 [Methanosarcinaceae archaeon]|nr:hypothetical protein [Methanosarcinaceae archaeon]